MGKRRSSLAELEGLLRFADAGSYNLGPYIAEFGAELAPRLCIAPEVLASLAGLSDEELAPQLGAILQQRAEERAAHHEAAVHQTASGAARRLAATAVWQNNAAAVDPAVLLGDLLLDTSRQHIAFEADGIFAVSIPRRTLVETAKVLPRQYRDLAAWVDDAGVHFRWRRGRGGLNFTPQIIPAREAAFVLHVHVPPPVVELPAADPRHGSGPTGTPVGDRGNSVAVAGLRADAPTTAQELDRRSPLRLRALVVASSPARPRGRRSRRAGSLHEQRRGRCCASARSSRPTTSKRRSSTTMTNGVPAALTRAQQRIAAAGGRHIGDLISWNSDRIDIGRVLARQIFGSEGLAHLIPDMDPATALSRAAAEVKRSPGILVRPFARPKGDTSAAVGIYVQKTREGEAGDDYVCGARCRVDRDTGRILWLPPDGAAPIDGAMVHGEAMAAHANHLVTHCETKDISAALVGAVKALSGVPLRDRGGFYLLPPTTCPTWARLKPGLEQLGVQPIRVEMHDAADNVAVAKAAAQGALEADIAELITDLDKAASEGMRQHALQRRVEVCKELTAKAELYRGVLAGVADKITAKVQELEQRFRRRLDGDDGVSFSVPIKD